MTKKSKMTLALASMLGITAGATTVSGFAWFATTKSADIDITNIGIYSKSSSLDLRLKAGAPLVGCTDSTTLASSQGDINLVGAVGESVTESQDAAASQVAFELKQYASATPTVKVDNAAYDGTVTLSADGKTVTLGSAPGEGKKVSFTYAPYAALTDTSSDDGQHIFKPTWTASGEGQYATAISENGGVGYVQFTMTLTATGNADLEIYLDRPSIDPVDDTAGSADSYAAAITRVSFVEDKATDETLLILQNSIGSNDNKGLNKDLIDAGFNYDSDDADSVNDLYDISTLCGTVNSSIFKTPDTAHAKANLQGSWGTTAANKTKDNNWLCTLTASETKTIIVTIWLEGTSANTGNTVYGKYANSLENGMISVNLPIVAF